MNRSKTLLRTGFCLALLSSGMDALAASTNPKHSDICNDQGLVDRQKLAIFVLDTQAVSRRLDEWATANPDSRFTTIQQRIVADEAICDRAGICTDTVVSSLYQAQSTAADVLKDNAAFENPRGITDLATFFSDPSIILRCRTVDGKPVQMAGVDTPSYKYKFPVRVRGNADSLIYARDTSDFKAADKATLSFTDDNITDKRTTKVAAVAGYPIKIVDGRVPGGNDFGELIPYVGFNRNVSKVEGQAKSVTSDNWRFGTVFFYRATRLLPNQGDEIVPISHFLIARPEYIVSGKDDSEIASLNLVYMPVINSIPGLGMGLNVYQRIDPAQARLFSYRPILDFRFNNGVYTDRGSRLPEESRDFSRVGLQFGLALSNDNDNFPIDLTVTKTYLFALSGEPDTIGQFKSVLSFALDPKRYFGFDISYVRGRREDLADREDLWTIGFGIKY